MSASKKKGTRFETQAENYLRRACGSSKVSRQPLRGATDGGDLHLVVGGRLYVIECKNVHNPTAGKVRKWCEEAAREAHNASADGWILFVHRDGCGRLNFGRNLAVVGETAAGSLLGLWHARQPLALDVDTLVEFVKKVAEENGAGNA